MPLLLRLLPLRCVPTLRRRHDASARQALLLLLPLLLLRRQRWPMLLLLLLLCPCESGASAVRPRHRRPSTEATHTIAPRCAADCRHCPRGALTL